MGQYLYWILAGLVFGVANVIPGVSGGTMAVVFGIYERLIGFASDIWGRLKKDWKFILFLGAGAAIGILVFAKFMGWVLENHPALANAFFTGVILGSLPMLARKAFRQGQIWRFSASTLACMALTLAVMICTCLFQGEKVEAAQRTFVWQDGIRMLIFGAVAAACMIVPGISGSFVLVLIGGYGPIVLLVNQTLDCVLSLDAQGLIGCWPVIPFALGVLGGVVYCARLIRFLLTRFKGQTYGAILGFVLGSVLIVFPGFQAMASAGAIVLLLAGAAAILACDRFGAA